MTRQETSQAGSCLLSGASGMLGAALRQALEARSISTLRLVRSAHADATGEIAWNPAAEPPVASTVSLEGSRWVVHLSGTNIGRRWSEVYKRELVESRVASTAALSRTLAGLKNPPETLVVASAVGFYGDRGEERLEESSAPGSGFLAALCQQWEQAADPARAAGIRVVHLRLGVILSPRGGALDRMLPLFRLGLGGPLGSGRQWMSWVSLADAVRAILFALQTPALSGAVNLTAPEPIRNADFTRALAHRLHRPAFLRAPAFALRLALGEMAQETLLTSTRAFPVRLEQAGFVFTHREANAALIWALAGGRGATGALF